MPRRLPGAPPLPEREEGGAVAPAPARPGRREGLHSRPPARALWLGAGEAGTPIPTRLLGGRRGPASEPGPRGGAAGRRIPPSEVEACAPTPGRPRTAQPRSADRPGARRSPRRRGPRSSETRGPLSRCSERRATRRGLGRTRGDAEGSSRAATSKPPVRAQGKRGARGAAGSEAAGPPLPAGTPPDGAPRGHRASGSPASRARPRRPPGRWARSPGRSP